MQSACPITDRATRMLSGLSIRVLGAHAPLAREEVDRLYGISEERPRGARLARLTDCCKIVVMFQTRLAGLVAYQSLGDELRVYEIAIASGVACDPESIVNAALDALELACLAAGIRRIVVISRAGTCWSGLWHHGFTRIDAASRGSWLEKRFHY